MAKQNKSELYIIVMSCDAYSDVWTPFSAAWEKFWPTCPYPLYLISEEKAFVHKSIANIRTGKKMQWGEMLISVLDQIETPHILYLQEDYLLRSKVDEFMIEKLYRIFRESNAAYLRLFPWPGPDLEHPKYEDVGILSPDAQYRTSLQAAIWDRNILQSIVEPNDDGRFEGWSIARAREVNRPFLCVKRNGNSEDINHDGEYPLHYFATAVFQGKWLKEAIRLYKGLGIEIDTSHRGVMNRIDFFEYHLRKKGTKHVTYRLIKVLKLCLDSLCSFISYKRL